MMFLPAGRDLAAKLLIEARKRTSGFIRRKNGKMAKNLIMPRPC
jgi:hypothetical protein